MYTVKTGYWILYKEYCLKDTQMEPSCSNNKYTIWSNIWDLQPPPPKVKTFLWRALHGIIPTEANLYRHHVPVNPRCTLCGYYWANTSYALFFCEVIKKLWNYSKWWQNLKPMRHLPLQRIFDYIKDNSNKEDWENLHADLGSMEG